MTVAGSRLFAIMRTSYVFRRHSASWSLLLESEETPARPENNQQTEHMMTSNPRETERANGMATIRITITKASGLNDHIYIWSI